MYRSVISMLTMFAMASPVASRISFGSICPYPTVSYMYMSFNDHSNGRFNLNTLKSLPGIQALTGQPANVAVQDGSLRMKLPKGCVGTGVCSYQWKRAIDKTEEALYSYVVKFPADFDWVLGGKLPGLCGNTCPTGGRDASRGFSARNMWRANGKLVSYLYYNDKKADMGEDIEWRHNLTGPVILMPKNKYIRIDFWVKLNTVGKNDGFVKGFYNGALAVNRKVNWRLSRDIKIDTYYFSNFYGGSGKEWASTRDNYIYFNELRVCAKPDWLWYA